MSFSAILPAQGAPLRPIPVRRASITILAPPRLEYTPAPDSVGPSETRPGCFRRGSSAFPPRAPSPYPQSSQLLSAPSLEGNPSETPSDASVASAVTEGSDAALADDERKPAGEEDEEDDDDDGEGYETAPGTEDGRPSVGSRRSSAASASWLELKRRASIPDDSKASSVNDDERIEDKRLTKGNLSALLHWTSSCEGNASHLLRHRVASSTRDNPDDTGVTSDEGGEVSMASADEANKFRGAQIIPIKDTRPVEDSDSDNTTLQSNDTIQAKDLPPFTRYLLTFNNEFDAPPPAPAKPPTVTAFEVFEETAMMGRNVLVNIHKVLPLVSFGALVLLGMRWCYLAAVVG